MVNQYVCRVRGGTELENRNWLSCRQPAKRVILSLLRCERVMRVVRVALEGSRQGIEGFKLILLTFDVTSALYVMLVY